ncbi:unnamed protein product, partial [Prorocentrum cordatum]
MCDRAVGSRRLAVVMRSLRLCRPHQAFVECDFQATSTDGLSWLVFVGGLWRFGDAGADALQPQHVQVFDRKTNNTWGGVSCFLARVFVAGAGATRIRQALSCPFEPAGGIPCADRAPGGGGSERPALGEVRGGGSAREESSPPPHGPPQGGWRGCSQGGAPPASSAPEAALGRRATQPSELSPGRRVDDDDDDDDD